MVIAKEKIFGQVVSVFKFKDTEGVIRRADYVIGIKNKTIYIILSFLNFIK